MKRHAIIPVFIPHLGCPHSCVFCNQRAITARSGPVSAEDVRRTAEQYLSTLENSEGCTVEMSFFGGSFTGIPIEDQSRYLAIAKEYKDAGRISSIHMSTRPDYIDRRILDNLASYGADVIELGVQSFDPEVLRLSERGHTVEQVYEACSLIKEYGFTLGIQLMIGLPGDSYGACMDSVAQTVKIRPQIARIYPTVIISGTRLAQMYLDGSYVPFSLDETLRIAKDMYLGLTGAGINVIRVGLKASALINDGEDSAVLGDTYHPAFRQLLDGAIARDRIEERLRTTDILTVRAGSKAFSGAVGHKGANKKYFAAEYPQKTVIFKADASLGDYETVFEDGSGAKLSEASGKKQ